MTSLHPAAFLLLGGLLLPVLPLAVRRVALLLLPLAGFANLLGYQIGDSQVGSLAGYELHWVRVDQLSLLFGYLFHVAAFLAALFSLHLRDRLQQATGFLYAGAAVGAVFAGDLIALFIFWELLAISSVFQIWANQSERAIAAGTRYLLIHISSGLLLLVGTAWHYQQTGSLVLGHLGIDSWATRLIFLGVGIKCAFPFLHSWLVDAYPESTPTGAVFLSSFTTKTAVYVLARSFAGTECLLYIGAAMAMFPIFYAVIENDLRRVLGYSMINQIGFMVVGVGLGPGMGINGAIAHAFNDVLFKGLLFMSMGAVLYRTGRINGSDLGGLYKSMPWTCGFCMIGAASISAFPLFSGFVSKSMVMQAAANEGHLVVWLLLLFASAGVFHHAGIKIPFFAFFAHDAGIRCREAPRNMLLAMGIGAALCIGIGSFPHYLYRLLPYPVDYNPYDATHIVLQLQLLFFSALAFVALKLTGIYPPELRSANIDVDWTYRKLLPGAARLCVQVGAPLRDGLITWGKRRVFALIEQVRQYHGPTGVFARSWPISSSVLLVTIFLAVYLFAYLG